LSKDVAELMFAFAHGAMHAKPTLPVRRPLMDRDPLQFWQIVSALLAVVLLLSLAWC
jgi:hypothetical protein